jgi:hypothetical protein
MTFSRAQAAAIGLRPAICAVDPRPVGPTLWGFFAAATTPEKEQRLADELVKHLQAPGRARVLAVCNIISRCPPSAVSNALRVVWLCQPGHTPWQALVLTAWVAGSHVIVEAAQDRETLRQWPDRADLLRPAPFLRPFCLAADELPEQATLYRGGTHDVGFLRDGFSWTPHRHIAARYAELRRGEHGGTATILSMTVPRERISLWTRSREAEVVIVDAEDAEVDTTCPETIQSLADLARPIYDDGPLDSEMLRLGLEDDASWCDWSGDE